MTVGSLTVETREGVGRNRVKHLRKTGRIPAILYGHGQPNVTLSVCLKELDSAIRHGAHVVDLKGAVSESALIKSVQWDSFGHEIIHVDLTRVSVGETVKVTLTIELKGEAPGARQGGVLQQPAHEIEINCPVASIPDKLELNVTGLGLGQMLHASDVKLPEGATLVTSADVIVAICSVVQAGAEEAPAVSAAEPEVIGRKKAEEEAE